ncbi:MAG TPA: CvpA family protein [Clostridia bacterium]|nr:CvpA family protein [Clostridia bacterium]
MNWTDLIVLAVIIGFAIWGMKTGFILSVYRLASYFISILLAIKLYPIVSSVLRKTVLFTNIDNSIYKSLMHQQENREARKVAAKTIVDSLNLPGFIKDSVLGKIVDQAQLMDASIIVHKISHELAGVVVDIISLALLYILVRVILIFARFILKGISKLPVFKQIDKVGGFLLGGVEGLLTVYILFAILTLFRTSDQLKGFFEAVSSSAVANFFYQHNFIIQWMFPS